MIIRKTGRDGVMERKQNKTKAEKSWKVEERWNTKREMEGWS